MPLDLRLLTSGMLSTSTVPEVLLADILARVHANEQACSLSVYLLCVRDDNTLPISSDHMQPLDVINDPVSAVTDVGRLVIWSFRVKGQGFPPPMFRSPRRSEWIALLSPPASKANVCEGTRAVHERRD